MRLIDWHRRYILQAFWTLKLRQFLLNKIGSKADDLVLDLGSGTGALFQDFQMRGMQVVGVDKSFASCQYSYPQNQSKDIICGNGYELPLGAGTFDLAFCHYLLLWTRDPAALLREMLRVTKPGGYLIAFAEPDYSSRIDYPETIRQIGQFQNNSLEFQGVDLEAGRKLSSMFRGLGLSTVTIGLLAGEWKDPSAEAFENEWDIIAYDLAGLVPVDKIIDLRKQCQELWMSGEATVFIPTFYAYGRVPEAGETTEA